MEKEKPNKLPKDALRIIYNNLIEEDGSKDLPESVSTASYNNSVEVSIKPLNYYYDKKYSDIYSTYKYLLHNPLLINYLINYNKERY